MSIPLQIPARATLDVVDGGLALRNTGDIVLHGEHTFVEVAAGGKLVVEGSLTCQRVLGTAVQVTGSLKCDLVHAETVTLAGSIEARRIEGTGVDIEGTLKVSSLVGKRVVLRATQVEAKGIQGSESVLLGPATYAVEVVLAPQVTVDPAAGGRINVLECHNTPPQNGLKGKFRLAEYAEFTGVDPAEFLQQRGVEPLPGKAPAGLADEPTTPRPIKKPRKEAAPAAPRPKKKKAAKSKEKVEVPLVAVQAPIAAPADATADATAGQVTADLGDPFTDPIPGGPDDPFADPQELQASDLQPVQAAEVDDGTRRLDFLMEDIDNEVTEHTPPPEDDVPAPGALLEDAPPQAAALLPPGVISLSTDDIEELDLDAIESLDEPDSLLEIIDEDSLSDTEAPLVLDAEVHRHLVECVDLLSAAYPVTVPQPVARLRTLVNQSEYRMVQQELPDLFNALLREHMTAATRPQHRVYTGFNRIHVVVRDLL